MVNNKLKSAIIDIVENQLKANDPKCTRETLNRLIELEYSEKQAKEMIASVVVEDIYDVMKNQAPFDEEKYSKIIKTGDRLKVLGIGMIDDLHGIIVDVKKEENIV